MLPWTTLNDISIGSAVFAEIMIVTDGQTDIPHYSVTIGCIYVCGTAMWPNNNNCSEGTEF